MSSPLLWQRRVCRTCREICSGRHASCVTVGAGMVTDGRLELLIGIVVLHAGHDSRRSSGLCQVNLVSVLRVRPFGPPCRRVGALVSSRFVKVTTSDPPIRLDPANCDRLWVGCASTELYPTIYWAASGSYDEQRSWYKTRQLRHNSPEVAWGHPAPACREHNYPTP